MLDKKKFYIDGKWVSPIETKTCQVIDPSNEEPCAEISLGGKKDVDKAVSAAKKAFETWAFTTKEERLELLEKLFLDDSSMHVGIRGPLYSRDDLKNDAEFGFKLIHCDEFQTEGIDKIVERIRKRVGNNPLYLSIDIDVLDPAHAPGTGTPEIAGMTTREMVNVLRGLSGMNLISADVVEVAPAYDHAELTSLAAATIIYELTNLFANKKL